MHPQLETPACRVLGISITGAGHARRGEPGQDAIEWLPAAGEGMPLCLAVADGHGGPTYFRSGVGARLAVKAATEVVHRFLEAYAASPPSLIKRTAEERLPSEIVREWSGRVRAHLQSEPFTDAEIARLEERSGPQGIKKVADNPLMAYGSTILAAGVTASSIVCLQLGDGDLLMATPAGDVFRPLPRDERSFADETTSLCLPEASNDFRVGFQATASRLPALVLLATDGFANCYASERDFLKVGSDLVEAIRTHGLEPVEQQLTAHLQEASHKYSGDDITLGVIWFPQAKQEQPCNS